MKKIAYALLAVAVLAVGYFYAPRPSAPEPDLAAYSSAELGLEFRYRTGPDGYVVDERIPADLGELTRVIILRRAEDAVAEPPVGGEGAPTITVSVFSNERKQFPLAWAESHLGYSNLNLKTGGVAESVVGGAKAIRYPADGLYPSENAVVAHGDSVYVFTGQYLDRGSDLARDFAPLLGSVRFIPKPGQG
jgi:hypothetical protein